MHSRSSQSKAQFDNLEPLVLDIHEIKRFEEATTRTAIEPQSRSIEAGNTIIGQFIAHDMMKTVGKQTFNTPAFDLDSVYGGGPMIMPWLFEQNGEFKNIKFHIPFNEYGIQDVPRCPQGVGLAAEFTNAENELLLQFHVMFLRSHNALVDYYAGTIPDSELYSKAKQTNARFYQYFVLQYLDDVAMIKQQNIRNIQWGDFLPSEFSVAAFRFGHAMLREEYKINSSTTLPLSKLGFFTDPENEINWTLFFGDDAQRSNKISPHIVDPMHNLTFGDLKIPSVAFRNISRGVEFGLASGQDIARYLNVPHQQVIQRDEHWPLWYYILVEADAFNDGELLGTVGSHIVRGYMEHIVFNQADHFINIDPSWDTRDEFGFSNIIGWIDWIKEKEDTLI